MAGPGQARFYSSTFVQTSIASGISAGATSYNVGTTTGAPGTPFVVSVDQNSASEELMLVTNVSGLTYTVTRGVGGTSAVSHSTGASVVHVMYAQDLTDASAHIGAFDNVHGLSVGSLVVGTTDTQTLTNKTLTSPTLTTPTITTPTITGTTTAAAINSGALTSTGLIKGVDFQTTGLTGAVAVTRWVGATTAGAPVSGTFAVGDWIVATNEGIVWICNGAGTPGNWIPQVNLSTAQTLSNKTISAGVFTGAGTGSGSLSLTSFIGGTLFAASGNTGAANATRLMGSTTSGAPTTGTFSLADIVVDQTGQIWICTAAGTPGTWVAVGLTQGLMSVPITTTSNGTATTGTTDTLDAVLGNYQFTAVSGRRYRVVMSGLIGNSDTAAVSYAVRVRNSGSASTPTTASTAVIDQLWVANSASTGAAGRAPIPMEDTFIAGSSGTQTLAFFAQRQGASGVFTAVSPSSSTGTGPRKLWVEDLGAV
jgi:hypothetical protein